MLLIPGGMLAAAEISKSGLAAIGVGIGCGFSTLGAGLGIGLIGSKGVESVARQPEASSRIFTTMIIIAAIIEGVTFFALIMCFLMLYWMR
jgi:F-type H+-transporting ATPase subunit c